MCIKVRRAKDRQSQTIRPVPGINNKRVRCYQPIAPARTKRHFVGVLSQDASCAQANEFNEV